MLRRAGRVRSADLVRTTGASTMTIRRDLADLEDHGVLRRTHGGAERLPARGTYLPYAVRRESRAEQKRAIGRAAAEFVEDGSSVIIDDGTTCTAAAEALAGRDLTVLALSVPVAAALSGQAGPRVLTPGGELNPEELSWNGHRAVREVQEFHADIAVMGVCGWADATGLTSSTVQDADVKKSILSSAQQVIAVSTEEKIGAAATFAVGPGESVDTVVTDQLDGERRAWLEALGVEVIEAGGSV